MQNDEIESSVLNIQSVKDVLIFPLTVEIFQHIIDITNKTKDCERETYLTGSS